MNPGGVSKHGGFENFCKYFNIAISQTMAFRDGGNDISMLKSVKGSFPMGNAEDNVKKIADFTASKRTGNHFYMVLKK